jgi:hypothetical protein
METDLIQLIQHPEEMDKDSLYELRSLLAVYPYFQTARLLMLQNLYLLHDPSFDEELRRAAIYITDRRVIFNLVEAAHYQIARPENRNAKTGTDHTEEGNRTISLIDDFLSTIPKDEEEEKPKKEKRKPTPADASVDYVAYLMQAEEDEQTTNDSDNTATDAIPEMKHQDLIDNFIENDNGKIQLKEIPEYIPQLPEENNSEGKNEEESYFTETLARIYIKQGRYSKALEIIQRLSLDIPQKNAYFADQIRFLKKLIINNNHK